MSPALRSSRLILILALAAACDHGSDPEKALPKTESLESFAAAVAFDIVDKNRQEFEVLAPLLLAVRDFSKGAGVTVDVAAIQARVQKALLDSRRYKLTSLENDGSEGWLNPEIAVSGSVRKAEGGVRLIVKGIYLETGKLLVKRDALIDAETIVIDKEKLRDSEAKLKALAKELVADMVKIVDEQGLAKEGKPALALRAIKDDSGKAVTSQKIDEALREALLACGRFEMTRELVAAGLKEPSLLVRSDLKTVKSEGPEAHEYLMLTVSLKSLKDDVLLLLSEKALELADLK